jgi:hypothetical protein
MKPRPDFPARLSGLATLWLGLTAAAATLPPDWANQQAFDVPAAGLVKISLPAETLDTARPALEDLRLWDDAGHEVPYQIAHPVTVPKTVQPAKSFQISLNPETTVITLETGLAEPVEGVALDSPGVNFLKAVRVEGSADGKSWRPLVEGQPVFRQPYGASHLHIALPAGAFPWLRLTVDDRRSPPVPFTGARVYATGGASPPGEWSSVAITARDENPGETRLALDLGAANLNVATVQIQTAEPLFMRRVTLAVPQITEAAVREQSIAEGSVYRTAIADQPASENLSTPVENQIHSRELFLLITNGDSPPLPVAAVRIERRPVWLAFEARQPGTFHLLTGNPRCATPVYDLAGLNLNLKTVPAAPIKIPPPAANPDFHAPEVLPGLEVTGAVLGVSDWQFRKRVTVAAGGAQQLELDLDVLAHAQAAFADLRLMHGSNQVPYLLQHTSIRRTLTPLATATNDAKNPRLSRWRLRLPRAGLPLTRLACAAQIPLFERSLTLYEVVTDERGDTCRQSLAGGSWRQTPDHPAKEFSLTLDRGLRGDTLILETDNGDNPPLALEQFKADYPVTRLLFKAKPGETLYLYYGNADATPPSYDLSLVAGQLLAADKKNAAATGEEPLQKSSWRGTGTPGRGGLIFWGILAVVVAGLLVIIARLLPKPPAKP